MGAISVILHKESTMALVPRVHLSLPGARNNFTCNLHFKSRCRVVKEKNWRKGKNWTKNVGLGSGGLWQGYSREGTRIVFDKSCKGQLIPVVVPTIAKLWNEYIKPSKLLHSTKRIPDGRISSVWFSAAAWCPHQFILWCYMVSRYLTHYSRPLGSCAIVSHGFNQSDGLTQLDYFKKYSPQILFKHREVIIQWVNLFSSDLESPH